jgi:hypothetical protein
VKAHPAADLFPMLPEYALAELARDIEANGLHDPICVWNGQIVDGRHRMAAVVKTMRAPCYREMEFKDEAECVRFIISTNIHRRHLTESQRAMIANELAKLGEGRPGKETAQIKAVSQAQAADMMQVSRSSVQAARRVSEAAPDLAAKVKAGEIKVSKAAAMARERTATPTDPDRADDRVVDATAEAHADGYTKKMEAVWSAYWKLDETEKTAFHERQREKGMAK